MNDKKLVDDINLEDEPQDESEDNQALSEDEQLEASDLSNDLSAFLEKKMEIIPDRGVKLFLPSGIEILDAALGGGFPVGAISLIVGTPGSGKTMLASKVIASSQKMLDGNLLAAYLDSEESITKLRLAMLGILNPKLDPYNNLTIEKVFRFVEGLVLFKQAKNITTPGLVVWDSIANTLSEKEHEVEDVNQTIGYKARLLSAMIPRALAKCSQNDIAIVAINQFRDIVKIGKFQPANDLKLISKDKSIPGGNAVKFNAYHLLEMKVKKIVDPSKFGFDGIITKLKCVKNKAFAPNIELEIIGSFNTGFSNFWTNYRFLRDNKRLESGAWNKLISLPEKKFRTKDARSLYYSDPEFKEAYDEAVKETIQTEILDKYAAKLEE